MIATSFLSKNFLGARPSASPANSSAPSLPAPSTSDLPFVTQPLPQVDPLSPALSDSSPGWETVQYLDSLFNLRRLVESGEVWTILLDHPSQIAVHLICYGYDDILVTIEPAVRNVDSPYLTQSAIFYCQPGGQDARIIFDQGASGTTSQLMIMPIHDPSNDSVDRWTAVIEEPVCGSYTGAFPGAGINTCPSTVPTPSSEPAKSSSPAATSLPTKRVTTTASPAPAPPGRVRTS